jgi:hypothetical protein
MSDDYRSLISRLMALQDQAAGAMSGRPSIAGLTPMAGAVAPTSAEVPYTSWSRQPTPAATGTPPAAPALRSPTELMNAPVTPATDPPVPAAPAPAAPAAPAMAFQGAGSQAFGGGTGGGGSGK